MEDVASEAQSLPRCAARVSMEQAEDASSEEESHDHRGPGTSARTPIYSAHLNNDQDGLPVSPPQEPSDGPHVRAPLPSAAHVPPFTEGSSEDQDMKPSKPERKLQHSFHPHAGELENS